MKTELKRELTLQDLAPYLPYGLKMKVNDGYGQLIGIGQHVLDITDPDSIDSGMYVSYDECKPLLVPMSECEEILNNDDYLCVDSCHCEIYKHFNGRYDFKIYPTGAEWIFVNDVYDNFYKFLFEHHFDVFGLLDAGLALDKLQYSNI